MINTGSLRRVHNRLQREYTLALDKIKLVLDGAHSHVQRRSQDMELGGTPSTFDATLILWLFRKYSHELPSLYRVRRHRLTVGGQYDDFEGVVFYMMLRHFRPNVVVELGTCRGYSALYILTALEMNQCGHLVSFEMNTASLETAKRVVEAENLTHRVEFVTGDCKQTFLLKQPQIGTIDLLSVDADHSYEFGQWWTANLPEYVSDRGLIHVHDIPFKGKWQDFEPQAGCEEGVAVGEFLTSRSNEYICFSNHILCRDSRFLQQTRRYWSQPFRLSMNDHSPSLWIRRAGGTQAAVQ